jgi:hypothetical protein
MPIHLEPLNEALYAARLTMNLRAIPLLDSPACQLLTIRSLISSESDRIHTLHLTFLAYPPLWVNLPDYRCKVDNRLA